MQSGSTNESINPFHIFSGPAWKAVRIAFPDHVSDSWTKSIHILQQGDTTQNIARDCISASASLAKTHDSNAITDLANAAAFVLERAGRKAASGMISKASRAGELLQNKDDFQSWLSILRELASAAPEQVALVCNQTDTLFSQLDVVGFRNWVIAGLTSTNGDQNRQTAFFSLNDPTSIQVLKLESSDVGLVALERRLTTLLAGLWQLPVSIYPAPIKQTLEAPPRTSFDGCFIRCPASFPGYRSEKADALFKASIAHIGAHIKYSSQKLQSKSLKPIQVALISILEDTRIELLAGREYPGLLRLWRSFHVVQPSGSLVASNLLERLSHALINPDYKDDYSWIVKGRALFSAAESHHWEDPNVIRRIGVILGNDLGQMRIQFNPKTYVVQPAYRDDNLGIWDFGSSPLEVEDDFEVAQESVRLEQADAPDQPSQRQREDDNESDDTAPSRVHLTKEDAGLPICRKHEWDYLAGCDRPDWVTIMEYESNPAPLGVYDYLMSQQADIERKIASLISESRVGRPHRLRRQFEGDRLDLDACIRDRIDQKAGLPTDDRIYETTALLRRDLSVLVLLDISESTKDLLNGTTTSVFSIERTATALLAQAMDGIGDPFAISAFCSDGRHDLRYYRVKSFNASYDDACKNRLTGLKPGLSTRMGAALRQAGSDISQQGTHRRLILVITDGEPSDVDIDDRQYLVEDARKAVHELSHEGINVFCVGLDGSGDSYLSRIFGRRNAVQIDRIENLPEQLPMLYFRLVA